MRTQTDSALASLLLVDRAMEREVKPLTSKEYWSVVDAVGDPAKLLGQDAAWLAAHAGLPDGDRLARLLDGATRLAFQLEEMERTGLRVLTPFDGDYPDRLRERLAGASPPVLYVVGDAALLSSDGIGVVGSRDVSPDAAKVAREAGELIARERLSLFSGGAKGVDQISMNGAIEAGGVVVGILADALERRLRDPETRRLVSDERVCLISPYKPSAGFSVANAMGRNKLIYALARRTFVVAADTEKGGTWAGATESLKRDIGEVAVWLGPGKGPGNDALVEAGAIPIEQLEALLTAPAREPEPSPANDQLSLDL